MRGLGAALALAWALLLAPVAAQTAASDGAVLFDIYSQQTAAVKTSLANWCRGSAPYDPCSTTPGAWTGVKCATVAIALGEPDAQSNESTHFHAVHFWPKCLADAHSFLPANSIALGEPDAQSDLSAVGRAVRSSQCLADCHSHLPTDPLAHRPAILASFVAFRAAQWTADRTPLTPANWAADESAITKPDEQAKPPAQPPTYDSPLASAHCEALTQPYWAADSRSINATERPSVMPASESPNRPAQLSTQLPAHTSTHSDDVRCEP